MTAIIAVCGGVILRRNQGRIHILPKRNMRVKNPKKSNKKVTFQVFCMSDYVSQEFVQN